MTKTATNLPLSPNAACKRANRRGYKTTRIKKLITLVDRDGTVVLKDATADAVDSWLQTQKAKPAA
jgi:hypothetical protein